MGLFCQYGNVENGNQNTHGNEITTPRQKNNINLIILRPFCMINSNGNETVKKSMFSFRKVFYIFIFFKK